MPRLILEVCLLPGLLGALPASARAEPLEHFQRGLGLFESAAKYRAEHPSDRQEVSRLYRKAADAFRAVWEEGAISSELFTNTGNSYYFAGLPGKAVLFYRRALAADPGNEEARASLEHVRAGLPIRPRRASGTAALTESVFFWHREANFHLRRTLAAISFPLAWVLFGLEAFVRRRSSWRGPLAIGGYLVLAISLMLAGSLIHDVVAGNPADEAIVLVEVRGRTGPGTQYTPSHRTAGARPEPLPFPPGTEVKVLDRETASGEEWLLVELLDGSRSWVPATAVERVIPAGAPRSR